MRNSALYLIFALALCLLTAQDFSPLDPDGFTTPIPASAADQTAGPWRYSSPGAAAVQLYFETLHLPPGARLTLRALLPSGELGAVAAVYENVGPRHGAGFWTDAVAGESVVVELDRSGDGPPPFEISTLRHLRAAGYEKLLRLAPATPPATSGGYTRFRGAVVPFQVRNGLAIVEDDIILGPVERVATVSAKEASSQRESIGATNTYYRWPGGIVPYEIDPALPNQYRITDAVAHWNTRLAGTITLRPRAGEAYYIRFTNTTNNGDCWSYIGNIHTAAQPITLGLYCGTGAAIHEIGHAVGLYHEQSREDRDTHIRINFANITAGMEGNFSQAISSSDDLGAYDYGSIMHYSAYAFSSNGLPTIDTIPAGIPIGQQTALSAGDIAGVRAMYPATVPTVDVSYPFTVRNTNGVNDITRVYFQLYTSATVPANSCHGFYDRAANAFYLYNDGISATAGPLAPGGAGTIQNSQCRINGPGTSVSSPNAQTLSVNLSVSFFGAYGTAGKNLYVWATGTLASASGWQQAGAWDPNAQPPALAAASPTASTSPTQTFALTARDPNGATDLQRIYFLAGANTNVPVNGCHGFYDRSSNAVYLYNDALNALAGPLTPGSAGTIQNSQCRVNGAATSVTVSGSDLVLNLDITRLGTFAGGAKNLYLWITDNENNGTGWVQASTWTLPALSQPPSLAAAAPTSSTAATQSFTLTTRDADGFADIQRVYFLLNNNTTIPTGGCHGVYDRASNAIYLYNDGLNALVGTLPIGSTGSIQNSQCRINGAGTAVTTSGTDVVLTMNVTRLGGYATGTRNLYVWIIDNEANGTGWVQASAWTIAGTPQPPALAGATPTGATSATQTFTLTARDADGFADVQRIYFLINSDTTIGAGGCHGVYDRASNSVYLYNDSLIGLAGSVQVGSTGSAQNSQCRINGVGTSVTASGTDVVLNLNITRQGTFTTGAKNLYLWIVDNEGNGTGWQQASIWTL
jgi:hypothetical protein